MTVRFVCPVCGRKTVEVPRLVADDSRSRSAAERTSDQPLGAPPACTNGHAPATMRPA
ncbi:MAG TPA: hypothetical protein VHJ34_00995 [Actinomycetota bacterium]|nr:hypothetical protein [Actinomycetota bacterium]